MRCPNGHPVQTGVGPTCMRDHYWCGLCLSEPQHSSDIGRPMVGMFYPRCAVTEDQRA